MGDVGGQFGLLDGENSWAVPGRARGDAGSGVDGVLLPPPRNRRTPFMDCRCVEEEQA